MTKSSCLPKELVMRASTPSTSRIPVPTPPRKASLMHSPRASPADTPRHKSSAPVVGSATTTVEEDSVVNVPVAEGPPVIVAMAEPAQRKEEGGGLDNFLSLCAVICILLSWVLPWSLSLLGVPDEHHNKGDYPHHNDCS